MTSHADASPRAFCPHCGYERTGSPTGHRCPECATTLTPVPFQERRSFRLLLISSMVWPSLCFGAAWIGAMIPLVGAGLAVPFLLTGAVLSVTEPSTTATDEYTACPWDARRMARACVIALCGIVANAAVGLLALALATRWRP